MCRKKNKPENFKIADNYVIPHKTLEYPAEIPRSCCKIKIKLKPIDTLHTSRT